jgi:hypothetical protein
MINTSRFAITLLLLISLLSACQSNAPAPEPTTTPKPPETATPTHTSTATATKTQTLEPASPTPTQLRPTLPTATNTVPVTPTPDAPLATVAQQAHCRYGPGTAYLHAADLFLGDQARVDGRNSNLAWLWIQPAGLDYHCWAAASVLVVDGDIAALPVVTSNLPYSDLYGPPKNVQAWREDSQVLISWDPIPFTVDDDRGYMLQLTLCQGADLVEQVIQTFETSVFVQDDTDCKGDSGGILWGVEKHGYTQAVEIPWP